MGLPWQSSGQDSMLPGQGGVGAMPGQGIKTLHTSAAEPKKGKRKNWHGQRDLGSTISQVNAFL